MNVTSERMQRQLRAFIAAVPDRYALEMLASCLTRLRPLANYKWVSREQLHLTLCFLGDTPAASLHTLAGELDACCRVMSPFEASFCRVGAFPNREAARVLWLGLGDGAEQLGVMAASVRRVVKQMQLPLDEKKFQAHLTLARLRSPEKTPPALNEALDALPEIPWHCSGFTLFRSELTQRGPIYTPLKEYTLE